MGFTKGDYIDAYHCIRDQLARTEARHSVLVLLCSKIIVDSERRALIHTFEPELWQQLVTEVMLSGRPASVKEWEEWERRGMKED